MASTLMLANWLIMKRRFTRVDQNSFEQQTNLLKELSPENQKRKMCINLSESDEFVIFGYRKSEWKTKLIWFFYIFTLGFLRLFFHWFPKLHLFSTHTTCDIKDSTRLLIMDIYNGKHKQFTVKKLKLLNNKYIEKKLTEHKPEIDGPVGFKVHYGNGVFQIMKEITYFKYKKLLYIWNNELEIFSKLRGLDLDVPSEVFFSFTGLTKKEQFIRRLIYGDNKIVIQRRSIVTLFALEVLNPFYVFQIASFILWFLDDYYYYASAISVILIVTCGMLIKETRANEKNLEATVKSTDVVTVLRRKKNSADKNDVNNHYSEVTTTDLLVPGDVIEIPSHGCVLHCDALLITGNCILNESMLTGESVPVTKTPFPNIPNLVYSSKEHSRHTLFCGTQVIQTRYFDDKKVLAVVIRTGFYTTKGNLIRSIMYPAPVHFQFDNDSYRFIGALAMISFCGFLYTAVTKSMRRISWRDLFVQPLDLVTIAIPPDLPAAITMSNLAAQTRLKRKNVICTSPRSIHLAGSINCFCFDKTGTLTEEGLDLHCIVPVKKRKFHPQISNAESLPHSTLLYGLATCHSLTTINQQIVGDPLDLKMFESTKWILEEVSSSDNTKFDVLVPTVVKPSATKNSNLQMGIVRQFPFSSSSQKMGVIVRKLEGKYFEFYCKGSPETILKLIKRENIPDNFFETLEKYTRDGYRVIALAHKKLYLSYTTVQRITGETIEENMNLLGLVVFENKLKPESGALIKELNDATVQLYMVTGDNILTAISVARNCGIIKTNQNVITVSCDNSTPPQLHYTFNNSTSYKVHVDDFLSTNTCSRESIELSKFSSNYRFAMCGKTWSVIRNHYPNLLSRFLIMGSVFARMTPDLKQQLIEDLKTLGYYVGMCGDGANDYGALRAAHAGISVAATECSIACSFSSKDQKTTHVLDVIKEGRAGLVTSFGIFKLMASVSLCQFVSVFILYDINSNLTDFEFLFIDLPLVSVLAFFFSKTEASSDKLVKEIPLSSLISLRPLISLFLQLFLILLFQIAVLKYLFVQPWYVPFDGSGKIDDYGVGCMENYVIFCISCFQYIILSIVFNHGKPHRKSILTNFWMILSICLLLGFTTYLTLHPSSFLMDLFDLVLPEDFTFRWQILIFGFVNFVISIFTEVFIVDFLIFKKLRCLFQNKKMLEDNCLTYDSKLDNNHRILNVLNTSKIVYTKETIDKHRVFNNIYENDAI